MWIDRRSIRKNQVFGNEVDQPAREFTHRSSGESEGYLEVESWSTLGKPEAAFGARDGDLDGQCEKA
jgi:hypothetical protein